MTAPTRESVSKPQHRQCPIRRRRAERGLSFRRASQVRGLQIATAARGPEQGANKPRRKALHTGQGLASSNPDPPSKDGGYSRRHFNRTGREFRQPSRVQAGLIEVMRTIACHPPPLGRARTDDFQHLVITGQKRRALTHYNSRLSRLSVDDLSWIPKSTGSLRAVQLPRTRSRAPSGTRIEIDVLASADHVDVRTTGRKPNWLCPS